MEDFGVIVLPATLRSAHGLIGCLVCGTHFVRRGRQLYCGSSCVNRAWRSRHPQSWRQLVGVRTQACPWCREVFATRNLKRIFCGSKCKNAVVRQHWREDPVRARAAHGLGFSSTRSLCVSAPCCGVASIQTRKRSIDTPDVRGS